MHGDLMHGDLEPQGAATFAEWRLWHTTSRGLLVRMAAIHGGDRAGLRSAYQQGLPLEPHPELDVAGSDENAAAEALRPAPFAVVPAVATLRSVRCAMIDTVVAPMLRSLLFSEMADVPDVVPLARTQGRSSKDTPTPRLCHPPGVLDEFIGHRYGTAGVAHDTAPGRRDR